MTAIRWTETAASDLESIRDYIANDSPTIAQLVVARLYETVSVLADYPDAGRTVPNATTRAFESSFGRRIASFTSVGATRS